MNLYEMRKALSSGKSIYDLPLRVTYYARVSTEKDHQKNSLENQDTYYKKKILSIPKWTLVNGYTDDGITGTSTKKRDDFKAMIQDGLDDMYDLILTKEVCRFARNTIDTLQITRGLLANGKGVYFELDNINTLEQEGELRLTIMASLAQDESRRLSERTKFGFNRAIESGRVLGNNAIWGYEKDHCKLKVNEEEAYMVKRVFELYSTGEIGIRKIGQELAKEGIVSRTGKPLGYSTLRRMLENPKYKGFYCGKKTEVIDFLTKERVNIPEEEWVMYKANEDIVPQIIEDELWEKCKEIYDKRSKKYTGIGDRWNNKYQYSNILICANDNKVFWRKKHRPDAKEEFWICSQYAKDGMKTCDNNTYIGTNELNCILEDVFSCIVNNKKDITKKLLNINSKIIKTYEKNHVDIEQLENELKGIEENKKGLVKLYSMNKIDEDEFEALNNEYKDEILEYKSKIIDIKNDRYRREMEKNADKIKEYFDFDSFEITKEFIHKKISCIYVKKIEKNYVRLKINFHLDLTMSEVDKKSICLGLIICIDGAVAFNFTPNLEPCFTISGSSSTSSSIEGVTIP